MADSGDGERCSFACGGPIYVPDLVSPVTSVLDFKFAVVRELQGLEAELTATGDFEDELNVDELKIFTEEELVEKALKEDLEDYEDKTQLVDSGQCSYETTDDSFKIPESKNCTVENTGDETRELGPARSLDDCTISSEAAREQLVEWNSKLKKRGKKRGRRFDRNSRATQLGGDYFGKVEQLAELKKKQEEDKAAARLHSFNGSIQLTEGNVATAEKIERLQALRFITSPLKVRSLPAKNMPITNPEVVLCVEIYSSRVTSTKTQEFLVLGRQLLTELRDNIYCLTDQLMQEAGQHDPSGYFLIEDWFLNDLRDPSAIDYSKPILDWLCDSKVEAEKKWSHIFSGELRKKQKDLLGNTTKTNLPNLKSTDMHKTRFCDLRFRLGAGYLYCHQGDCKHTIVIRDMRLIHPEDDQNMVAYPIHTFQIKLRTRKCSVCYMCAATKVTVDDKWAENNPSYFCDSCYYLLHYNEDGTLLYNEFTVYDYRHE